MLGTNALRFSFQLRRLERSEREILVGRGGFFTQGSGESVDAKEWN